MTSNIYFIKTERLGFRKWCADDLDLAIGLWGDLEVTKLFDARSTLSKDQIQNRLNQEILNEQKWSVQYWPFFLLKNNHHAGACGLRPYDIKKTIFEIGFHLRSDQWDKGYATEAARAIMRYAFIDLKVRALFAGHHPKNTASSHILTKLGFRYTHDEYYEPTGLRHPSYGFAAKDFIA